MNKLLLVGNGFDLAHGLLTKYEHFLYLMKNWDDFYNAFENIRKKDKKHGKEEREKFSPELLGDGIFADLFKEPEKPIDKYLLCASKMDKDRIEQLGNIIKSNSWVKYYSNCEAEIDGWIDFEKEIHPVIDLFDFIFNFDYELEYSRDNSGNLAIPLNKCSSQILKTAELWDAYIDRGPQKLYLKSIYISNKYGILKKRVLRQLRSEFNDFILAFEIYLSEIVYKREDIKTLKQINEIGVTTLISFNYTLTERLYGLSEKDVHHIHGRIRSDLTCGNNNMVMGVNEQKNQSMDFIYFVKYFQRIQKASGVKYKRLTQRITKNGNAMHKDYEIHIYGHSLDETDEDILKYVIGNIDRNGELMLKPKKVYIYYYDDGDFEQKVINLIRLYGRSIVEEYMEKKLFRFVPTSNVRTNTID